MSRFVLEALAGTVSLVTGIVVGYRCDAAVKLRRNSRDGKSDWSTLLGAMPLVAGLLMGSLVFGLFSGLIVSNDRFYSPAAAFRITLSILGGVLMIGMADYVFAFLAALRARPWDRGRSRDEISRAVSAVMRWKWFFLLLVELIAVLLVVGAGVRFSILGIGTDRAIRLGAWSVPLTVLWILAAANMVRLLDGLEGATNVLLLVAAVAVFYVTLGVNEFFLNTYASIVIGAVLASLRFNFYPARLPLSGTGTVCVGFVFAILTVLARQKTVVALLLIFPLVVAIVLVGGAMLSLLERVFSPGDDEPDE